VSCHTIDEKCKPYILNPLSYHFIYFCMTYELVHGRMQVGTLEVPFDDATYNTFLLIIEIGRSTKLQICERS